MERNLSHLNNPNAKSEWYTEMTRVAKSATAHMDGLTDGMEAVHHTYEHVIEGFSARLTAKQAAYLKTLPGVLSLQPDRVHKVSTTHSPMFLGLTASGLQLGSKYDAGGTLWSKSEFGSDVIIGVMDTGVWPERASFADPDDGMACLGCFLNSLLNDSNELMICYPTKSPATCLEKGHREESSDTICV